MMSTLWGIILGVVMAAVITVYCGDLLQRLLPQRDAASPVTAAVPAPEAVLSVPPAATPEAVKLPMAVPDDGLAAMPLTAEQADRMLAQRWQEYAENAAAWQPVGEFRWRECFVRAAATHGVPESLLLAVASGESGFDPAARSGQDAVGLMQIQWPGTSHHLGIRREADLYDPCTNVSAGARYLSELTRRYGNDLYRAVAAYNYGPGRINEGTLPQGAHWYSQYIYQHLQRVLGRENDIVSEPRPHPVDGSGYQVLLSFNHHYRARDFLAFLHSQAPQLDLAQRSELLGRHEVVLLYADEVERQRGIDIIERTGLLAFAPENVTSEQEKNHVL
jgi:hypothetical protein